MSIQLLLQKFPKTQPPLPDAIKKIFEKEYKANRDGKGIASKLSSTLEGWMHVQVAKKQPKNLRVLELGAGTLNHLKHEDSALKTYDIVEPYKFLFDQSPLLDRISAVYNSVHEIAPDKKYDRIISIAVLEHVLDLPDLLRKSAGLLERDGVFQAGIPSEGGFLWKLAWRLSTGLSFRLRTGLDYGDIMRHEHVNNADEIITLVKYFFREVKIRRFPLPFKHLSLYTYLEARN